MSGMKRMYADIQEMISSNCTEDQVIDFVITEYGFGYNDALEIVSEFVHDDMLQKCNYAC